MTEAQEVRARAKALRERREDIIPLINHFLMVENQKYHTNKSIYSDTIDAFDSSRSLAIPLSICPAPPRGCCLLVSL